MRRISIQEVVTGIVGSEFAVLPLLPEFFFYVFPSVNEPGSELDATLIDFLSRVF